VVDNGLVVTHVDELKENISITFLITMGKNLILTPARWTKMHGLQIFGKLKQQQAQHFLPPCKILAKSVASCHVK